MLALYVYVQTWISDRLDRDRGATAVEYGLMVALIAVAVIGIVAVLGKQLGAMFTEVNDKLPTVSATP
ncbi:Flp family type IVb pilin [Lentzea sp. NBRC 105346]|uniref:Flp family type IVb pilin n=1 Tax=Lentzea sp. NBRC 105346 TaxID=3032205 RepID=UPI002556F1D9|nr:Flp family type IVb pilin [Lentzea sp. NBRC 105346]